jgi:hypothetical protein
LKEPNGVVATIVASTLMIDEFSLCKREGFDFRICIRVNTTDG